MKAEESIRMSDSSAQTSEPEASRPWMPSEYGVPATEEGMMTWEHVTELLRGALDYWIATTSADGRPHVRPVWAVWIDGILYFDGHPATGWGRNSATCGPVVC